MKLEVPTLDEIRAAVREVVREELAAATPRALEPDDLLTTDEAAAIAKLKPETIASWCRSGLLPGGRKPYRVKRSDLLAFLARRDEPKGPPTVEGTLRKLRRG